jgi:hypothetical protein
MDLLSKYVHDTILLIPACWASHANCFIYLSIHLLLSVDVNGSDTIIDLIYDMERTKIHFRSKLKHIFDYFFIFFFILKTVYIVCEFKIRKFKRFIVFEIIVYDSNLPDS